MPAAAVGEMLELRGVHKHFPDAGGSAIRAVDGVSFKLSPGEFVAIYGPSGSGKTTMLLLMAGIVSPDRGTVLFEGRDLARLSNREVARYRLRELGFVFQTPPLAAGLSAVDNAALKLMRDVSYREARVRVAPLLERVGLADRAHHPTARLSAGERQRVALARALSYDPCVVLADEPTGNLDTHRSTEILTLLRDLSHERRVGVVLVTHDPRAADLADRVHELHDGQLLQGKTKVLGRVGVI